MPVLYAVNELGGLHAGLLSAFEIAPDGGLTALGSWPVGGELPCHLAIGDGHLYVANYGTGSIAAFVLDAAGVPTRRTDLVIQSGHGPDPHRQEGPHVHMVVPVDGGLLAIDLGTDAIYAYSLEPASGTFGSARVVAALRPGSGPRHLTRDLAGLVHVVGELDATVTSYEVTTAWREMGRTHASVRPGPSQPSEIGISPDGRFLYVANRGPDTIAVFTLEHGLPQYVAEVSAGGAGPRHFAFVDDLLYVANQDSDTVVALRRDPDTGDPPAHRQCPSHAQPDLRTTDVTSPEDLTDRYGRDRHGQLCTADPDLPHRPSGE